MMQYCLALRKPPGRFPAVNARKHRREIIKALMEVKGLSQRRLAEAAQIDQSSLSKYLSEKTEQITVQTLQAIANTLEVSTSTLLGETDALGDPKIAAVVHAMERMPEYRKDAVVAASSALATQTSDDDDKAA